MLYIEAPDRVPTKLKSLFLAGSITDTANWQRAVVDKLSDLDIAVYNPRRKNFPMGDPKAAVEQITWEHVHLNKADAISFWFAKETNAPITLFELGAWSKAGKPIVIGIDPKYTRKKDIEIQMGLERPDIPIVYKVSELVDEIYKMMGQVQLV